MDMKRKMEIAQQSIRMIAQADDTDSAVRAAALDRLSAFIDGEREASQQRLNAAIQAHDDEPAQAESKLKKAK